MRIYGNIMLQDEFFRGTIEIKDGILENVWKKRKEPFDFRGTVIPTFINMHTHIGDFSCQEEPRGKLEEIVGPGGFKYKVLRNRSRVYRGMRRSMKIMESEGISHFVDFREGGKEGIDLLIEASRGMKIIPVILGRIKDERIHGIGLSSISDYSWDFVKDMADWAKRKNKLFAIHFSERIREDVEKVLSLNPIFVIHALQCTDGDLIKLKEKEIAVVVTPRANMFFGSLVNIPRLLKFGLRVALGTDNGMISLPSIFREMEAAYKISKLFGEIPPLEILKMATTYPRKILGIRDNVEGEIVRLILFKRYMSSYEIVNKSSFRDIRKIIL